MSALPKLLAEPDSCHAVALLAQPASASASASASAFTEAVGGVVRVERVGFGASVSRDGCFIVRDKHFSAQYANIYVNRLAKLRAAVTQAAQERWPNVMVAPRVSALQVEQETILVGTLYKSQKLKRSVLSRYLTKDFSGRTDSVRTNFVADDDSTVLEDDVGRVCLAGTPTDLPVHLLITGLVVAVRGKELGSGEFLVHGICFPGVPPLSCTLPEPHHSPSPSPRSGRYIALVSGLRFGRDHNEQLLFHMMADYLTGFLGGATDHEFASQVVRLIVAGDILEEHREEESEFFQSKKDMLQKRLVEPLRNLDAMFTQLAASVSVDVMPGHIDPSNVSLPQQPFSRVLFPSASTYETFHPVTNPFLLHVEDTLDVLGTSGQNVADIFKYSEASSVIQVMKRMLQWRHLCPSSPDTLTCYPFKDRDPFVIGGCPNLFFVGNQKCYATELYEPSPDVAVRLVAIPQFCQTGQIVLVNIDTLDAFPVQFSMPLHS